MPTRSTSTTGTRIAFRYDVFPSDMQTVAEIVASTGFFNPAEVEIAVELVEDRLEFGDASGYFFVFAEQAGQVLGYTCYGPIAGTDGSFDLYWIANHRDHQATGAGPGADAGNRAADPGLRRSPRLRRNLGPPPVRADPRVL